MNKCRIESSCVSVVSTSTYAVVLSTAWSVFHALKFSIELMQCGQLYVMNSISSDSWGEAVANEASGVSLIALCSNGCVRLVKANGLYDIPATNVAAYKIVPKVMYFHPSVFSQLSKIIPIDNSINKIALRTYVLNGVEGIGKFPKHPQSVIPCQCHA